MTESAIGAIDPGYCGNGSEKPTHSTVEPRAGCFATAPDGPWRSYGHELGVAKRTVQRDIAVLESAGFPVISEARNGTVRRHFMEGFHAEAPVSLTLPEQMVPYFSKGLLKPLKGTPIYESLDSALQKIGAGSLRRPCCTAHSKNNA